MIFVLVMLFSVSAFVLGIVLVRTKLKVRYVLLFLSIALVLFRASLIYVPLLDITLFPFDWYPVIETWWFIPFLFFLFGTAAGYVKTPLLRIALFSAQGIAFLYFTQICYGESFTNLEELNGITSEGSYCIQTKGYSCGSAAGAAFLSSYKIRLSEREMAYRSHTKCFFGTTVSGMVRGLAWSLPDGRKNIVVGKPTMNELNGLKRPILVVIRLGSINHWIIVDSIVEGTVNVRDPLGWGKKMNLDEFQNNWLGTAIWLSYRN